MRIDGAQWNMLTSALTEFPLATFDRLLRFELNQDRENIALGNNKTDIVYRVIEEYNFRDQVELLVLAARRFNPTDRNLHAVAQQFGIATQIDDVVYDGKGSPTVTPVDILQPERTVRAINSPVDGQRFAEKLLETESRICRVEKNQDPPRGIGTGFLVGPDTVMTNFHVVDEFIDPNSDPDALKLLPGRLRLRFDYSFAPDGAALPAGTEYRVSELLASSPMSPFDKMPAPTRDAASDELDYALLRVEGTPGDDPAGGKPKPGAPPAEGKKRGWIVMPAQHYDFTQDAPLLIYQHLEGGPLKLAIETNAIESINDSKTRVVYRTNTEPGASGSPCFDMDWNLIALHRAGGWRNQGVPFAAILKLLTDRNQRALLGANQSSGTGLATICS